MLCKPVFRHRRATETFVMHKPTQGPFSAWFRRLVPLPNAALAVPNTYLVWSEVSYNYTPVVGITITGSIPLADQMFMSPRITPPVYDSKTCT